MVDKPLFIPRPIQPGGQATVVQKPKAAGKESFDQALQKELQRADEIKFSRHAVERLQARDIRLEQQDLSRLNEAFRKAEAKGCRESLVMMDNLALVVSIKNRTVITAVDGDNRKENVFTNIDSALII